MTETHAPALTALVDTMGNRIGPELTQMKVAGGPY
jgi:hypothetical protein